MPKLNVGNTAPAFELPSSDGRQIKLSDYKDKNIVVLYFYPKDDTPGCTIEACGFRDEFNAIRKLGAVILGVSPDSVIKHEKFIEKYSLPFPLLSDEEKSMCRDYGVWVEKSMYGRKYMGVERATFIIGKDGRLLEVFAKVKPDGHTKEVIECLKSYIG